MNNVFYSAPPSIVSHTRVCAVFLHYVMLCSCLVYAPPQQLLYNAACFMQHWDSEGGNVQMRASVSTETRACCDFARQPL